MVGEPMKLNERKNLDQLNGIIFLLGEVKMGRYKPDNAEHTK